MTEFRPIYRRPAPICPTQRCICGRPSVSQTSNTPNQATSASTTSLTTSRNPQFQISWPKIKRMAVTPNTTNHLPLKICNMEVQFVVTYLGSLITNDGSSSRNITYRIAKAASAMCRPSYPLFRKHRISIRTKINLNRALVVSVLNYELEAWSTTLADRRRLDVFDMRC